MSKLRAICIIHAPSGLIRIPAMCTARVRSSITKNTMKRTIPDMPTVATVERPLSTRVKIQAVPSRRLMR